MTAHSSDEQAAMPVEFMLNGERVNAAPGQSILQAARAHGVEIPHLCYKDGLRADGNCRACVVEIKGERALAPSCCRAPSAGMEVSSNSTRAVQSQKMVLELLLSDMPEPSGARRRFRAALLGAADATGQAAVCWSVATAARFQSCRHCRQPGCLYPVHALCARLS